MNKFNIAVFFGGIGPEHDVSKASAINVINQLSASIYNILPVYITKENKWLLYEGNLKHLASANLEQTCLEVTINMSNASLLRISGDRVKTLKIDLAFPVLHGKGGEDGAIQGLFECAGIKYIGSGILASALGIHKNHAKHIAKLLKIPVLPFLTYDSKIIDRDLAAKQARSLGYPVFIKPTSAGSSYGCSVARNKKEVLEGIEEAFKYSSTVLIEKFIEAREIEVAVLEDGEVFVVSLPGEITTEEEFYTLESKYEDNLSELIIPAPLPEEVVQKFRDYSKYIFDGIGASGLARVDFFLTEEGDIYFNEINTMPGFTDKSMYPKLLEAGGLDPGSLVEMLTREALTRV